MNDIEPNSTPDDDADNPDIDYIAERVSSDPPLNDVEITVFVKDDGPLTKRISLDGNGKPTSDGSDCKMARGRAKRTKLNCVKDLAELTENLKSNEAIGLGRLRKDFGESVTITTKNGVRRGESGVARTANNLGYRPNSPAPVLFDHDTKGMPAEVAASIKKHGGFWPTLVTVMPALGSVGYVLRPSTSAGLSRTDTGQAFPGSGGSHGYVMIENGADAVRFLTTLHEKCWLAGLGWMMVGAGGQLLERSVVDRMVGTPERLVFEGPPVVVAPLQQDRRKPHVVEGPALNSIEACPPLTVVEKQTVEKLKATAKQLLAGECNKACTVFIASHQQQLIERTGMTAAAARVVIEKWTHGTLLASVELIFDDSDLRGKTVGDVLDDPGWFEGETLADPIEGAAYGTGVAKVMLGASGEAFINSFAHGHSIYHLKYDATTLASKIAAATVDVVETFARLVPLSELSELELHDLIAEVAKRTKRGVQQVKAAVKEARRVHAARGEQEVKQRREAERNDPRPTLLRPPNDAPLTGEMAKINAIIRQAPLDRQIRRDLEGHAVKCRRIRVPSTHAFSSDGDKDREPPEQWMIGRLDEYGLTEELERLIDYVDENGRSVVPPWTLVKAYTKRDDQVLHSLAAIAAQPIVIGDGTILGREGGFEPTRGIQFMVPPKIAALVPAPTDCTPEAIARSIDFLINDWLVDVATDYIGKCVAIAGALTIMERSLIPERPVFVFDAGKTAAGKTTLIKMLIAAVTGGQAAASAWSMDDNERRKAITTYFLSGVPYILWDNIPRGHHFFCPHIERSCTAAYWADRRLGVNEMVAIAACAIHLFSGNNIEVTGDTAARSLKARLDTDRPDPENRNFTHPDIINWTLDNRDKILRALFTILLGNPELKQKPDAQMQTRFPMWWRLVGSAVENAASVATKAKHQAAVEFSFTGLFLKSRDEDEESTSLGEMLLGLAENWASPFTSNQVAIPMGLKDDELGELLRGFLYQGERLPDVISARSVGRQLKRHVGNVVQYRERTMVLKVSDKVDRETGSKFFRVEFLDGKDRPRAVM